MSAPSRSATFRQRLCRGERLLGTFVKTPHPAVVEVLARAPLDCLCIDAEHAPFDRRDLDLAILAARAGDMPLLVRVAAAEPAAILNVLDLGATGIILPHVTSAAGARAAATACRYGRGGRGYAGSPRAAGYGTQAMPDVIARGNDETTVIAQIEDAEALVHLNEIAAVHGIDALFIGRMDLTVSLGAATAGDAVVVDAVHAICAAGRESRRTVGMFTQTVQETRRWFDAGATLFLLSSDQQWLLQGAKSMREAFDSQSLQASST